MGSVHDHEQPLLQVPNSFFISSLNYLVIMYFALWFIYLFKILKDETNEQEEYTGDGSVDHKQRPALKANTGNWRACPFILGIFYLFFILPLCFRLFIFIFVSYLRICGWAPHNRLLRWWRVSTIINSCSGNLSSNLGHF